MTGDVRAVRDDAILDYALREMRRYSVRRAPVVRANGSLVAVISVDDVNEHLATQLTWLAGDAKPPLT